jgi:hypothetical protein
MRLFWMLLFVLLPQSFYNRFKITLAKAPVFVEHYFALAVDD